ncbi:MAG: outer membrane beta-barrel protein [Prevotella sp.]|nr:outer membrane beta-barrel protein [Prevotella sp.]
MKKLLLFVILLGAVTLARAQSDPEYRMEIGAGIGTMAYQGDFNTSITKGQRPIASLHLRYNFNPYTDIHLSGTFGKIKGASDGLKTYYPEYQEVKYEFNRTLVDVSATFEYNFWPYGTGRDYRGAKRLTPYIFVGLGTTSASGGDGKSVFTANFPIGVGAKYKIADRLNLGIQWVAHFSLSDELDGVKDPYYVNSKGIFKNTDGYTMLQVSLTYSFWAKCKVCHNQYE